MNDGAPADEMAALLERVKAQEDKAAAMEEWKAEAKKINDEQKWSIQDILVGSSAWADGYSGQN